MGEAKPSRDWPDYLQYGFDESDVPALLEVVSDYSLNQADMNRKEEELEDFSRAVFTLHNHVMQSLNDDDFQALFLERDINDIT